VREGVVIFDRWLPAEAPSVPALCLAPPAAAWLGRVGAVEHTPRWSHAGTHDVLAGLDPMTVDVARAYAYDGDGITAIARSDQGTPLIAVVDRADRRLVIMTFGLGDSNLVFAAAFPVLVGNSLEWLGRPASGDPRGPGLVALPASTSKVTGPDNRAVTLARAGNASYARLTAGGFYDVEAGGSHQTLAVNSGTPETSNLSRTTLANAATGPGDNPPAGRPWWLYLAGVALVLVTIEWWTWQRRITV
jgi:hypothetical protein